MKGYERQYPLFSLCGLNCGLCPIHHMSGGCPGCGGGEGHQSCPKVRCARQLSGVEYCFQCKNYPCEKYDGAMDYDSFLPTRNMQRDFQRAQAAGLNAYQGELNEKVGILNALLSGYNDGRRKTFFCAAVNLLELADLKRAMARLSAGELPEETPKERAERGVKLLQALAEERGISLRLNRPPRKK